MVYSTQEFDMEVRWYERGEMGERVLDVVESVLDGWMSNETAVRELKFLGLSEEEIENVFSEEEL
jgi:hypothetical protein